MKKILSNFLANKIKWMVMASCIVAGMAYTLYAFSQDNDGAIPAINLAAEPLYAKGTRDKPTLTLALSVEFPTVGAQYTNPKSSTQDDTYKPSIQYIGYFDSESCYSYVSVPAEIPKAALTTAHYQRFERKGLADDRGCAGKWFSGNFMNWASSSAIDILRQSMTGGDRVVDEEGLTILQRAVIPSDMYTNTYFPSKVLKAEYASGAVPDDLRGNHAGDIFAANCLNQIFFGTKKEGSCADPKSNGNLGVVDGTANTKALVPKGQKFFYTRVRVCDTDKEGVLLDTRKYNQESFCLKYPNGKYKPVGNLQKYSDSLRVAVFGYLNDSGTQRYGGVLRAPMKYVGPKYFNVNGEMASDTNPKLEWNEDTGVLLKDPEGGTKEGISGAINYINQFGRTGSVEGAYKSNDPIGELYYEALRYLQGLPPTSGTDKKTDPTLGMLDSHRDGFPVYTTWTDPHGDGDNSKDYSCLKNNLLVIGDIGTHADKYIPGNTRTGTRVSDDAQRGFKLSDNEPDFVFWTSVVGALEAGKSVKYQHVVGGVTSDVTTSRPASSDSKYAPWTNAYKSASDHLGTQSPYNNASYYIAGMAYWARNHDIRGTDWTDASGAPHSRQRPGMRVTTFTIDVNQNASSADATTRRQSQLFLAAKYGGFNDLSGQGNPYYAKSSDGKLIDDNSIWDKSDINAFNPAEPGEARTHFLSSSALGLMKTLSKIFDQIAKEGNSIAGGSISTQRLTTAGGFVYQAQFDATTWSGDVVSRYVRVSSKDVVTFSSGTSTDPHQWYAAAKLDARIDAKPDASDRVIVVGRQAARGSSVATNFLWSSIDDDLKTHLSRATPTLPKDTKDSLGPQRLAFIRGVRDDEGTLFRKRSSVLGDIINSGIAYSGAPQANITASTYTKFLKDYKDRTKALFVGANDGMLHAFDASDGTELFAYIPSWLGPKLSALTNTTYNTGSHQSYVDASPTVGEAETDDGWKTILVSGTGGGGQGVFALDVTDPARFAASKVMWEFTDRDDPSLGNVIGKPYILKFRTSAPGEKAVYKWFALVPGGVNNYVKDGYAESTGSPSLFLLDLSKSGATSWKLGTNYFKINIPVDKDLKAKLPTGVANVQVSAGPSGEVSAIHFGDLHGNLWKLNFASVGSENWNMNALSAYKSPLDSTTAFPFFVAKDKSGVVQPITMAPTVVRGPNNGRVIVLGTGKYLESLDNVVNSTTQTQSIYALYDDNTTKTTDARASGMINSRTLLKEGSVDSKGQVSVDTFVWGRPANDADTTQHAGWVIDFPTLGERQISGLAIYGDTAVFGSVIPPNAVTDPCGSGSGYLYALKLSTGMGSRVASQIGLLGEPFVTEIGSLDLSVSDSVGRRIRKAKGQIILQGSEGLESVTTQPVSVDVVGRLSWRQINNYHELRNAP